MKKTTSLFYFFLLVLLFYFWRNINFWMTSIIYEIEIHDITLFASLALTEAICILYIFKYKKLIPFRGIHKISFFWFLAMIVVLIYNHCPLSAYLKCVLWPLLFETTYICTILYKDACKYYRLLFILLAIMGCGYFFKSILFNGFESASNMVYFPILSTPILLSMYKGRTELFIVIAISALALISLKRSMMLALILYWVIYFLIYIIRQRKILLSVFLVFLLSIGSIFAYEFVDELSGGNISRRMEKEDVSNGREAIYIETLWMIANSSIDHKILGNGQNAVRTDSVMEISAHNEWLEVIYDYGYIVLFLYVLLWIYMLKKWRRCYKDKSPYFNSMTLCICLWSVMSMVSQLLVYVSYVIYLFMFLAYIEAKTCRQQVISK